MNKYNKYILPINIFESKSTNEKYLSKEQKALLDRHVVNGKYSYNKKTGLVDVYGRVTIQKTNLKDLSSFSFGRIEGSVYIISNRKITSLKGGPLEVTGDFIVTRCSNLKSLEYGPKIVGGSYYCSNCDITSLKGCPDKIGGYFNASNNPITSLKGCPKKIKGYFRVEYCMLTSLEDGPLKVGEEYNCIGNSDLTSIKGLPEKLKIFDASECNIFNLKDNTLKKCNTFYITFNNNLTSIVGGPEEVQFYGCYNNPKLTSLEGLPNNVEVLYTSIGGRKTVLESSDLNNIDFLISQEDNLLTTLITPEFLQKEINKNEEKAILKIKPIWAELKRRDPEGFSKIHFKNKMTKDILDALGDEAEWGF